MIKFQDISLVNIPKSSFVKYFSKGAGLHILLALTLLLIILLVTFSSRYYLDLLPRAMFGYGFIIVSGYSGRWLTKRWLLKQAWFYLLVAGTILFFGLSGIGIASWIFLSHYHVDSFFITIPLFTIVCMLAGASMAIARTVISQQLHEAKIIQSQKESELNLLIAQLSPHFLFNTLNNIYGMSLKGDQALPEHILKLSSLLRYSVYQAGQGLVSLKEEASYLKGFIDFEKMRTGKKLQLTTSFEGIDEQCRIAPMLLITFVENAFKHSKNTRGEPVLIDIKLTTQDGSLMLFVRNSYPQYLEADTDPSVGGLGLVSARKRLALLYLDNHRLDITKEEGFFTVHLVIKLTTDEKI